MPYELMNGGLAQLARALRWQRRGHRFESDNLHYKKPFFRFLWNGFFMSFKHYPAAVLKQLNPIRELL